MKLSQIAAKIGARLQGADVEIGSVAGIEEAQPGQLEPENLRERAQAPQQELFALVPGWPRALEAAESGAHFQIAPKNGASSPKTL